MHYMCNEVKIHLFPIDKDEFHQQKVTKVILFWKCDQLEVDQDK